MVFNSVLGGISAFLGVIFQGILQTARTLFTLPFRFQFGLAFLLVNLFILFNAPALYGANAARQQNAIMLYLVASAFVFSQTRIRNPLIGMRLTDFVVAFTVWFLAGTILFNLITPFTPPQQYVTTASIATIITTLFVVAIGEELLFRLVIPSFIPAPPMVAQVVSAIAFGVTHWFAYGGDVGSILFAIILGVVFGAMTVLYRNGLVAAMALHAAWNLLALGFAVIV